MAGTLFGLALSQQHDADGWPLTGGKLYIFHTGTQVPLQAYRNFGLSAGQEHPQLIIASTIGRPPTPPTQETRRCRAIRRHRPAPTSP